MGMSAEASVDRRYDEEVAKRPSHMSDSLEKLDRAFDNAERQVAMLEERVVDYLNAPGPQQDQAKDVAKPVVPERIDRMAIQVQALADRVEDLRTRFEG